MAVVKWSLLAIEDVNQIGDFIESVSMQYAKTQVSLLFEKASQLETHPLSGRPVPELNLLALRQLLCGHYRIIYEVVSDEEVAIVTIHHQSRLLRNNPAFKEKL